MSNANLERSDFGVLCSKEEKAAFSSLQNDLSSLMDRYYKRTINHFEYEWLLDLINVTRKYNFGAVSTWQRLSNSPYIYGQNLAFIDDSVKYALGTNAREMRLETWYVLLDWDKDKGMSCELKTNIANYGLWYSALPLGVDIVEAWCRRPNGPADMLCTLYALFCGNPIEV